MTTAATRRPTTSDKLTREQELELFQSIETAEIRIKELEHSADANSAELRHCRKLARAAKDTVIMANQGWVAHIAGGYQCMGLELEDLRQEGNHGLLKAIENFDHRRGNRFATYATWSVLKAITRALSKHSRTIRIPEHKLAAIRGLMRVRKRLGHESGTEPTPEEVAAAIGLPVERVHDLLNMIQSTVSLDAPVADPDGAVYHEFLSDASAADPAAQCETTYRTEMLREALETLTEREREVLAFRYGHKGGHQHTLEEIARPFGVSRERIRQIQNAAEQKLRQFAKTKERQSLVRAARGLSASKPITVLPSAPAAAAEKRPRLTMRSVEKNPNHHMWNNNGVWYCNFRIRTATGEAKRIRNPLHTRNVEDARRRRDAMILLYNNSTNLIAA